MKRESQAVQRFHEGDLAIPDDQPISVIVEPDCRVWAIGPYRGQCVRLCGSWWWRVWHVVGPVHYGHGKAKGVKKAEAACLARLQEVADTKLPGKDLWADSYWRPK